LAEEYQEKTQMLCDLPWSGWRGCYVILHVRFLAMIEPMLLFIFGHVRVHIIVCLDDLVSSTLLCWHDLVSSEII
jgi:hypothetical protein